MPSVANLVSTLHLLALSAFVGVTSVSMLVAVISRMRIRRPLLVWRSGPLTSLPLGPSLFLVFVALGFTHAWLTGRTVPYVVLLGYPAGGLFWFVATWIMHTVAVTEYGIIRDVSRISRAVGWNQIMDYLITTRSGQPHFVFFYRGADGDPHRLDLSVPASQADTLREIVGQKLDTRFTFSLKQSYEEETIDPLDDRTDLS